MSKAYTPHDDIQGWWANIPNTQGRYQASRDGNIRRVYGSGKVADVQQYKKCSAKGKKIARNRLFVRLTVDGKRKEVAVLRIMADTFIGELPQGKVAYHKNGIVTDNHVHNIGVTTRRELGAKTGHLSKARAVFKVDRDGQEIEVYKSARECARHNNMSYQTVLDRCNGKVKNEYALDGYTYRFEEAWTAGGFI